MEDKNQKKIEYQFHNVRNQVVAVFIANIIMLSHGCTAGWVSPALSVLQSEATPLESGPLTTEEISWMGSITCFGAMIGSVTFGYIATQLGCKRTVMLMAFPTLLFWLSIIFGYTVEHLYFARFISGWTSGGIQTCIPIFVGEIANNDIRGRLGTINLITRNVGILLAYVGGAYLEYSVIPFVFIFLPIIFLIFFGILPNTPQHLLKSGKTEGAKESLMFYKGCKGKTLEEEKALHNEFERLNSIANQAKTVDSFKFKYLLERECFSSLFHAVMLTFANQGCGCFTIITYANYIFEQTGTNFDSNMSSIVLAILLICGTLGTAWLVDNVGRKKLLLTSLFGCCVGLSSMGTYLYLESIGWDVRPFNWVPVASLGAVVLISALGLIVLPNICIIEWIPSKIRTFGLTVCTFSVNIFAFFSTKWFPVLAERIHLFGCMFIFASICAFSIIYFSIVMEETKGKSLDTVRDDVKADDEVKKNPS